jgi:hypothetical protein
LIKNKDLRLYEELAHRVAMDAAERRELTPELREVSRRLHAWIHERLDTMSRMDTMARVAKRRRRTR